MSQLYSSTIKFHYHHPRNFGKLLHYTHTAEALNPLCGDEIKVYLKIVKLKLPPSGRSPEGEKILDIKHEARGCMLTIAAASVLSEYLKGKPVTEIKKIGLKHIAKLLEVAISPARKSCATLPLTALKNIASEIH